MDKKTSAIKKRKTNLQKLCSEMNKYAFDANDKEVVKRFKTTIVGFASDIPKTSLELILKEHKEKDLELNQFAESLQPYIKHYLFMKKRSENIKPSK